MNAASDQLTRLAARSLVAAIAELDDADTLSLIHI